MKACLQQSMLCSREESTYYLMLQQNEKSTQNVLIVSASLHYTSLCIQFTLNGAVSAFQLFILVFNGFCSGLSFSHCSCSGGMSCKYLRLWFNLCFMTLICFIFRFTPCFLYIQQVAYSKFCLCLHLFSKANFSCSWLIW